MNLIFFRYFAKLNLAITLLLLIASFSIVGTIIEQNQTIEYYKLNYLETSKIFQLNWKISLFCFLNYRDFGTGWPMGAIASLILLKYRKNCFNIEIFASNFCLLSPTLGLALLLVGKFQQPWEIFVYNND